jgi:ribosomal protein L14
MGIVCIQVDAATTDSRFSAVFDNPRFNIDQSAPEYRQSDVMEAILVEKVKRRTKENS